MADKSTYLQYLPPVLWEKEPPLPDFSVGAMLRVFEKLLTGIDDDVVIAHGDHAHEPVQAVLDRLVRLYDPWTTPPDFLPWLASWVSLRLSPLWDDYQQRKVVGEIVGIYQRRGLKAGLVQYLDLYTVAATRPRIAIDDGSKVLYLDPAPQRFAPITALVSQPPLVAPLCIAQHPDGSLFVGDAGTPGGWSPVVEEAVWRLPMPGRYTFAGVPPAPRPVGPTPWNLIFPVALVVAPGAPNTLYVVDRVVAAGGTALYSLPGPDYVAATPVATKAVLGTVWPVAVGLDPATNHVLVLDRGAGPGAPSAPKVIDVDPAGPVITSRALNQVIEPLALAVLPNGNLIVGDGREQTLPVPADLVLVDRTNALAWVETRLLAAVPAGDNPLIAPTAVVREDADHVFVLDVGLKPLMPPPADPFIRTMAEPAAVYRVDLTAAPPTVTRASEAFQLVYPTGMVRDGSTLYVCDRGDYSDPALAGSLLRAWRAAPHELGIVVHFSDQRPTTPLERRQIVANIDDIVRAEQPAHTYSTLVFTV